MDSSDKTTVDGLVDSHCHFDFDAFHHERQVIWRSCQQSGVRQLIIPGIHPQQWVDAQQLCQQFEGIYSACGLHPWWVDRYPLPSLEQWQVLLQHPRCVAIGECGLDSKINTPLDVQLPIFEQHVRLAQSLQLPLIIHVRGAHNETIQLLKKYPLPAGGVIHGFTGSLALARTYWAMGFYLGVGGSVTYPRAKKTIETFRAMPLSSLILETDAPDMPLSGEQGKSNSPLALIRIAATLADIKQLSPQRVAQITTANSRALFSLDR